MSRVEDIINTDTALGALDRLAPAGREFDVRDVVERLLQADNATAKLTRTWLGEGDNALISPVQVYRVFGRKRIDAFAKKLGMERHDACERLADVLPELVDNASQNGRLLGADNGKSIFSSLWLFSKAG